MAQYHPAYQAGQYPELNQPLHAEDYLRVVQLAHELGLRGLDV
jgi:uncharacterized Fe-S radical SAM superfamily protein PflX